MPTLLKSEQKEWLLDIARQAISRYLVKSEKLKIQPDDKVLQEERGVFVTLKVKGQLRGCVGYPLPVKPLYESVIEMAIAAATQDYRFSSLSGEDLSDLQIEISVLSIPEPVDDPTKVKVGEHGIIVSQGSNKGLLLPQVPAEHGWDLETYLKHGCLKAGLEEDAWKKGASIKIFSAQVFGEEESMSSSSGSKA